MSSEPQILRFDDDLHVEARTVLAHSPEPQNAFEVAVVMETLGHTDTTAQALGYADLFDLARHVYTSLPDVAGVHDAGGVARPNPEPELMTLTAAACLFLGQALPWLTALFVLLAVGSGFWSSKLLTPAQSAALVLALSIGLVSSALFTFPFARRANFYRLQENRSLVWWTVRWFLGAGTVGVVVIVGACYLVMEDVMGAYTPGVTRSFFAMGVAVAVLQLAFAPLYTMRAFGWLATSTVLGVATLLAGIARVDHGIFTTPATVVDVQLAAITVMVAVALVGAWRLLGRAGDPVVRPRLWAVARASGPYALYGVGFFTLLLVGGLGAGGLWQARFTFVESYNVVTGAALVVLLPLFGYTTVAGERWPVHVDTLVRGLPVTATADASASLLVRLRRDVVRLGGIGLVAGVVMTGLAGLLAGDVAVAGDVWRHLPLFVGAVGAYVALAVGVLHSQVLFVVSRAAAPAGAVAAACATCVATTGAASLGVSDASAAVLGLLAGTVLFSAVTGRAAWAALHRFDRVFYGAL